MQIFLKNTNRNCGYNEIRAFCFWECILLVHIILPSLLLSRNKIEIYRSLIVPVVVVCVKLSHM